MSKKVQIVMQKAYKKLGKKNDVLKVAPGYAFNYLIPNKLAEVATTGKLKHLETIKSVEISKIVAEKNNAIMLQQHLENISKISIRKKTGDQKQVFGSISDKEIINQIYNYTGVTLEKKQINLPEIKTANTYLVTIKLFNNISMNLKLQVLPLEIKNYI